MKGAAVLGLAALVAACGGRVVEGADAAVGDAVAGEGMVSGACVTGADCDDGLSCTADQCEAGRCRNLAVDSRCGEGLRCDPGMGCVSPRCGLGRALCDNGDAPRVCRDILADPDHCGACDRRCTSTERCVQGVCQVRAGAVGARCDRDDFCAMGFICEADLGGLCSRRCERDSDPVRTEAMACGDPAATCLDTDGQPGGGQCVRACDPRATTVPDGACPAGFVCTGLWTSRLGNSPDNTGCMRFCARDEDCAGDPLGARCNPRTGRCGEAGLDLARIADGLPCDLAALDPGCRGFCLDTGGGRGLCASFTDRRASRACPDEPERVVMYGPVGADNLGLCRFRSCTDNCDCAADPRLRCVYPEDRGGRPQTSLNRICAYATASQPEGIPRPGACPP